MPDISEDRKAEHLMSDENSNLPDGKESKAIKSMNNEEFRTWLCTRESEYVAEELINLNRCSNLIDQFWKRVVASPNIQDFADQTKPAADDSLSRYWTIFYESGQELAATVRTLNDKLNRNPISFTTSRIDDLHWRAILVILKEMVDRSGFVPMEHESTFLSEVRKANERKKDYRPDRTRMMLDDEGKRITPERPKIPILPKTVEIEKLMETLITLAEDVVVVSKLVDDLKTHSSSAFPQRKNRLGLSGTQIGILGTLYPDKLLSAVDIATALGLTLTDKGTVPIEGQLKRDATLRRNGLIEAQRGVEGGYFLSDAGRQIYRECEGIVPSSAADGTPDAANFPTHLSESARKAAELRNTLFKEKAAKVGFKYDPPQDQ